MRLLEWNKWFDAHGARRLGPEAPVVDFGRPHLEYDALSRSAGLVDASDRDRLLVTGADRLSFIQGLCTNDLERLPEGAAHHTAFITPRGRLVADAQILRLDDALLIDVEAGRGEALSSHLDSYRIHEDCDWQDVSESLLQVHLWGPATAEVLGRGIDGAPTRGFQGFAWSLDESSLLVVGHPLGATLYVPAAEAPTVLDAVLRRVTALGGRLAGSAAAEARRIESGLGRFGIDWDESTNPLEAGLDRMLHYQKGCYVGQEVVAKATYVGQVAKRLVRVEWQGDVLPVGTLLHGGRAPGRLTSCARIPGTARIVGLAVVRRDSAVEGSLHRLGTPEGPEARVMGYPYRSALKPQPAESNAQ